MPAGHGSFQLPLIYLNPAGAQQLSAGQIYDPVMPVATIPSRLERPFRDVAVTSIRIPVAASAQTSQDPTAANMSLTLSANLRGDPWWSYSGEIPLVQIPGTTWSNSTNTILADDLFNPLGLDVDEVVELYLTLALDQPVINWSLGLGYQNPSPGSSQWKQAAGSAYYLYADQGGS